MVAGGGSGSASVDAFFAELHKCGLAGDYDRGLKISNKILQTLPDDSKALHCKVVCLIQLSNFKDAMQLLRNPKFASVTSAFYFEKAYVQYRLNLLKDALQTVDSAPELSSGLKELRAQILYRLEQYQECFTLYRDIVKNTNDEYEDERQTNMSAVYAYLSEKELPGSQSWSELSKYEVIYNAACREAMHGRISETARLLQQAESAAEEYIKEDGGGEEELAEETAIIKVQRAYCLQMQGKDKEATAIYQAVLKTKPSDQALVAIASNNLVVINKETNVFDSRKRIKAATQDGLEHKLTTRQRRSIMYNHALLSVYSNQSELCKQLCAKLNKEFGLEKEAILIESSSLARDSKFTQAINLFSKHPELKLAAVHLYLSQGDRKSAIKILESPELKFKPGIIGTLVTLYLADNNREAVTKLFEEAMGHLKGNKDGGSVEEAWHSRHGGPGGPAGIRALARLVVASAGADPNKALELAADLPPMKYSDGNVDVDTLETSNWMMGAKVVKKTTRQEQSPGTPKTEAKKKNKRKRKTKLPANVDLSVAPDPERWLPRYERTAFRKRRQRGPREVIKGSQGMTTSATDQYDMTKQQGNTSKSPRVVEKQPPSEPGWQKNKQQKKKRKGGKW